jgi:hypothetical protein
VGTPARGKEIFFAGAKGFFATKVHEGTVRWGHPPGGREEIFLLAQKVFWPLRCEDLKVHEGTVRWGHPPGGSNDVLMGICVLELSGGDTRQGEASIQLLALPKCM